MELHSEAKRRARMTEQQHGHYHEPIAAAPTAPYRPTAALSTPNTAILPSDFGADPTGAKDSTAAFAAAMAVLLRQRGPRHTTAANITDLGGATLDLSGGTYLISAPIVIPAFYANVQIVKGTLRASASFPAARFLVEIGSKDCKPMLPSGASDIQASCGQFINLSEMFFDASHVAAGGVKVSNTMGTTIGPSVFFTGFTVAGVHLDGGHECMIQQGWFAECEWSDARGRICQEDPDAPGGNKSHSVGILIDAPDNIVTDVIVFEYTHIGIQVNGAANLLQGVHTWNAGVYVNNPDRYLWKDGIGIAITAHQNRLIACYLDYSSLAVTDPNELVVQNTFFLGVPAVFIADKATTIQGVQMHGNTYNTGGAGLNSIHVDPKFVDGERCDVSEGVAPPGKVLQTTRASATVSHMDSAVTEFKFNFPALMLPQIEEVEYTFTAASEDEPWVQHRALKPNGTSVTVQMSAAVRGQVTMRVAQAVNGLS